MVSVQHEQTTGQRQATQASVNREQLRQPSDVITPCTLNGHSVMGVVDTGASASCISQRLVTSLGLPIVGASGTITSATSVQPRRGFVSDVQLRNGTRQLRVQLEVLDLVECDLLIGRDLLQALGIELRGISIREPSQASQTTVEVDKVDEDISTVDRSSGLFDENGIADDWRQAIADNEAIPEDSVCNLQGVEVEINTGDAQPVYIRPYSIPPAYQAMMKKVVDEWIRKGVVVASEDDCPWNCPLIAVKKTGPDGQPSVRPCGDFRELNKLIISNVDCAMPHVMEIIECLRGAKFITTLDLADAYQQFPIWKEDQPKTTFTFDARRLMFTKAPFGLWVMSGRVIRKIEPLLLLLHIKPFVDDIPIGSETAEGHVTKVKEVIERLTKANLCLRLSKCKFARSSAIILGVKVSGDSITMDPAKVESIRNYV